MTKLRKIKSGSALSPPGNREIVQKQMRNRYIRSIRQKRVKSNMQVATCPDSLTNSATNIRETRKNHATNTHETHKNYTHETRKNHTTNYEKKSRIGKSIRTAADAKVLNTVMQGSAPGTSGENGKPDAYAETWVAYAGQSMVYHAGSTVRPVIRGKQYGRERRIEKMKTGISGMLQSVRKAIKAMADASKSTAAAISIAGIGSTVVLVIVSVVLVLAMTISSSFGEYGLELSNNDLVNIALSQVGTESGEEYCKWYGFDREVGWCAIFVSWCGTEAGLIKKDLMPKFAWVPTGVYWFQSRDQWHANDYTPKPGEIIFFDWYDHSLDEDGEEIGQNGQADHVGIVEKAEGGLVYTVEGNTTQEGICAEKQYPLGYFEILGYGEILYP